MAAPDIEIDGLGRLLRNLKQLDPDIIADIKETHRDAAERVASSARPNVPRRTGKLQASLRVGVTVKSGVVRIGKKAVPYAGPIHFGWPARRIKPQPFLYDALDARRAELTRLYSDRLVELVGKVR